MEIIGRITKDATVKTLHDERKVVGFSIAINDYYKTKTGEKKQTVTYVDCSYWASDKIAKILTKGSIVSLYGRIGVNAYNNMLGEPKAALTFHVNNIKLVGKTSFTPIEKQEEAEAVKEKDDLPF